MGKIENLRRSTTAPMKATVVGVLLLGVSLAFAAGKESAPLAVAGSGPGGARNLALAPNLSFTDDSSSNFPIRGENLGDGKIAVGRSDAIFFGTSHCWN